MDTAPGDRLESQKVGAVWFLLSVCGVLVLALELAVLRRAEAVILKYGGSLPGLSQLALDLWLPHAFIGSSTTLMILAGLMLWTKSHHVEGEELLQWSAALTWVGVIACGFALHLAIFLLTGSGMSLHRFFSANP